MSADLHALLVGAGFADKYVKIDDHLARMQWGSAFVIVGLSGSAIVAIAPLFRAVPAGQEAPFYRKLLEHNAHMGGMASFAIQPDGWVVLHAGRAIAGLDGEELATMIASVGRFADQYDDQLIAEFYATQRDAINQAPLDDDAQSAAPVDAADESHSAASQQPQTD